MKKLSLIALAMLVLAGCSGNQKKDEMFLEAASACAQVCETHPSIKRVSSSAGAGLPLLFVGKMETACDCVR